jgi:hypothetical protein
MSVTSRNGAINDQRKQIHPNEITHQNKEKEVEIGGIDLPHNQVVKAQMARVKHASQNAVSFFLGGHTNLSCKGVIFDKGGQAIA